MGVFINRFIKIQEKAKKVRLEKIAENDYVSTYGRGGSSPKRSNSPQRLSTFGDEVSAFKSGKKFGDDAQKRRNSISQIEKILGNDTEAITGPFTLKI